MTITALRQKIAPVLPKGSQTLEHFVKNALLLQLQETSREIAVFEARYNKNFTEWKRERTKQKNESRYAYTIESDYLDWEALEVYKHDLMRVIHSL